MKDEILQTCIQAVEEKISEITNIFADLEISEDEAEEKGMSFLKNSKERLKRARQALVNKLSHNVQPWRVIGAGDFGAVYICPYCDKKAPEKYSFCPHCGGEVKK